MDYALFWQYEDMGTPLYTVKTICTEYLSVDRTGGKIEHDYS
jgi:hypothetical protein